MLKKICTAILISALMFTPVVVAEDEATVDINAKFQLEWDMGPESDLAGYIIMINGEVYETTLLDICNETTCTSPMYQIEAPGAYTFTVRAKDQGGFVSEDSNAVVLTVADMPPGKPTGCSLRIPL